MNICTFFGHRNTPENIEPTLRSTLIDLIKNKNVVKFYVGNHGRFDSMVRKNLRSLKQEYPHIDYAVVLAYMPGAKNDSTTDYSDTLYPHGLEKTPPKYAIIKRNNWMLNRANYVITYVCRPFGGAAQFAELAKRKGKIVFNLAEKYKTTME